MLETNKKLQDDFQREHLYEGLIDFMAQSNRNSEEKTLAYQNMLIILQILETGSMNEAVRGNLSDKKKIKDRFLVVVNSIEIGKNKKLISSLIMFLSNLCYGTGKLRQMLAKDDQTELMAILKKILDQIQLDEKYTQEDDGENQSPNVLEAAKVEFDKEERSNRSLLKTALYSLIGNLCIEKALRMNFANDNSGILSQVHKDFRKDLAEKKFDWYDMMSKQLAIFINVSIEVPAQQKLLDLGVLTDLEELVKSCKTSDALQKEVLERIFNLMSKMLRHPGVAPILAKQRHTVFKAVLYFNKEFEGDLQMNALRTLHPLCKSPGFRDICFNEHKFTASTFDGYVKEAKRLF